MLLPCMHDQYTHHRAQAQAWSPRPGRGGNDTCLGSRAARTVRGGGRRRTAHSIPPAVAPGTRTRPRLLSAGARAYHAQAVLPLCRVGVTGSAGHPARGAVCVGGGRQPMRARWWPPPPRWGWALFTWALSRMFIHGTVGFRKIGRVHVLLHHPNPWSHAHKLHGQGTLAWHHITRVVVAR